MNTVNWSNRLAAFDGLEHHGSLLGVRGPLLRARMPAAAVGDRVRICSRRGFELDAEVVAFDDPDILLLALGDSNGLAPGDRIAASSATCIDLDAAPVTNRILDGLGVPLDGGADLSRNRAARSGIAPPPPHPLHRRRIGPTVPTGIRAIDGLLTVGRGQRIGIFAPAGVGKSTLLGMLARNVEADRIVVALIGERGCEVGPLLEDALGAEGRARATVVVSTSDEPPLKRLRAADTAMRVAEAARADGEHVVLLLDSVTRYARALREVGLAIGEPPGRHGYPASLAAELPRLFERAGADSTGAITAFYTVLVAGDDLDEPVADEVMGLLDGHVILSRQLAANARYPAIDVLRSVSRSMHDLVDTDHAALAKCARRVLALHEEHADRIAMKLFEPNDATERAQLEAYAPLVRWLGQQRSENVVLPDALATLHGILEGCDAD